MGLPFVPTLLGSITYILLLIVCCLELFIFVYLFVYLLFMVTKPNKVNNKKHPWSTGPRLNVTGQKQYRKIISPDFTALDRPKSCVGGAIIFIEERLVLGYTLLALLLCLKNI